MCGLAGIWNGGGPSADDLRATLRRMTTPLVHRGPDDEGIWCDPDRGIGLGFRRLAIIDLSQNGHQPMASASGRYMLVFNGEVYNHESLRRELLQDGLRFAGHSDTEVILGAFERWGIERATRRFIGMFAMAVWDRSEHTLSLIRDRLGIKPLYVSTHGHGVAFGSELKALLANPDVDRTVDRDALAAYLRLLYVPAPMSILKGTFKVLPGHILTLRAPTAPVPGQVPYWSVEDAALQGRANPFRGSDEEAVEALDALLTDAVRLRLQADVPVGALLSGGIDSSAVVALMQENSSRPVRTFVVGVESDERFDEAPFAARIADHLGTDHTEITVSDGDALSAVPRLPEIFDEPLANPSQIPTHMISEIARRHVTVALSGDGGDEVFGGYNRYVHGEALLRLAARWPHALRRIVGGGIGVLSAEAWDRIYRLLAPAMPGAGATRLPGEKMRKIGAALTQPHGGGMYRSLLSAWHDPAELVQGAQEPDIVSPSFSRTDGFDLLDCMMLTDQRTYLPGDLLAKVDYASMAVSLEVRVPLLDHRVVEFAWRLPHEMKIRDGVTKWALRQVLYRRVPRELIERPKMGFSVPIERWLRGALFQWADDLLAPQALNDAGLTPAPIRAAWSRFRRGDSRPANSIWAVLMFVAWHERWCGSGRQPELRSVA